MESPSITEMWSFPWPVMDVLIGGKSSIDLEDLRVYEKDDASAFLQNYGYDPDNTRDQRKMHAAIVEALTFIQKSLLTDLEWQKGIRPPADIMKCADLRDILIWASDSSPADRLRQAWACALLRVLHTISHIEGVTRHTSVEIAREQIMGRFHKHIFRDKEAVLWLGDNSERVRLEKVEWKNQKTRHSVLLKLLHKRANVAETIYDLLGVRIVTTRLCDAMLAVKYLRQFHMITFANCAPSRSRNTLIDVEHFRAQLAMINEMYDAGSISAKEYENMIARLATPTPTPSSPRVNPHSATSYKAIQLTCRQLIRIRNPQLHWLDKLKRELDRSALPDERLRILEELQFFVEGWHSVREQREITAFFPFEVQILDGESYAKVLAGDATHDRYKRSQVRAARRRVLHRVLEISKNPR